MKNLTKVIFVGISILLLLFIALIIFRPFEGYKNNLSIEHGFVIDLGDYDFVLDQNGTTRYYKVHVPANYNKNNPTPLVFVFSGRMGSEYVKENYNFVEKSDKEGFIVVFPRGASKKGGDRWVSWNAGKCCSYAAESNIDDVGFVRMMLKDIKNKFNIDKNRIYATGMSNGARFSYRLACEMSDTFAAIAPVSGVKSTISCNPSNSISILHIHSTEDTIAPFNGGVGEGQNGVDYGSVADTINWWVENNKCDNNPERIFENNLSYCDSYNNYENESEVRLCVTTDGGHSWPGVKESRFSLSPSSEAFDATDMIWEFFKKHSKK